MQKTKQHNIVIIDMNSKGQGIGKIDGKTVFVSGAVTGDEVKVEIIQELKNYSVAKIVKLLKSSPARIEPNCNVAKKCGGCTFQFLDYRAQLKFKQQFVIEQMVRTGGFDRSEINLACKNILGMENNLNYRNKVQIPVGGTFETPEIGFYEFNSHKIVDNYECIVQHNAANIIREVVRKFIIENKIAPYDEATLTGVLRHIVVRVGFNTKQVMVILVINKDEKTKFDGIAQIINSKLNDIDYDLKSFYINVNNKNTNVVLGEKFYLQMGNEYIEEKLNGVSFKISPKSFFQVNTIQAEKMFDKVLEFADLNGEENVFDLYCGTGAISLLLASHAKKVYGIEIVEEAILDAKENAKSNKIENVKFIVGKSENIFTEMIGNEVKADVVVVDPPRKGVDKKLLDALRANPAEKIIYVSCNPATLARDCKILCNENLYRIEKILPVDMFPWTGHVEAIILMTRSGFYEKK